MSRQPRHSPRRINLDDPQVLATAFNDQQPTPANSLSWQLWEAAQDIAVQALNSEYMQGIRSGLLAPDAYGQYTLQDTVYCAHGMHDYQTIAQRAERAGNPELAIFASARAHSYAAYNQDQFAQWHLKHIDAIALSPAAQAYVQFEQYIAEHLHPIYAVLAMLPCEQLWPWLAQQLNAAATASNVYSFWIKDNQSLSGAYRLHNFIDDWFTKHPTAYDAALCSAVFRTGMTCELNFFHSACGQDLIALPRLTAS